MQVLYHLHDEKNGLPLEEVLKHWRYKQCGEKSIASLLHSGYLNITKGRVYFVMYPDILDDKGKVGNFTEEQLKEIEEISRRNLVYLYKDELKRYQNGPLPGNALPEGVKRSLQHLGVLKWKMMGLTDLGRSLLSEILSKTTPQLPSGVGLH